MPHPRGSEPRAYAFGPFLLNPTKRVLLRDGESVAVNSKTLDVLLALIERRDRTVSKDELLQLVWGDRIVEENNLFRQISRVRKVLEERPDEHRYIVTLPNEGYRFVGDVTELADRSAETGSHAADSDVAHATAAPDPPRRPVSAWLAAATLAAAALIAVVVAVGPLAGTTPVRPPAAAPALKQVTFETGFSRQPSWSPSGQSIAFVSDRAGTPDVWIKNIADQSLVQVTRSAWAETAPAWSPDGKSLVYRSTREGGGLYVAAIDGSSERKIAAFGYSPQWSPDGANILFTERPGGPAVGPTSAYVVPLAGQPRLVRPDLTTRFQPTAVTWHPDGRVSFLARDGAGILLATAGLTSGDPIISLHDAGFQDALREQKVTFGRFRWTPAGDALYFEGVSDGVANIWRVAVDPRTLAAVTGPERVTVGAGADVNLAVGPHGRLVFAIRASRTRLWAYRFDPVTGRLLDDGTPLTSGVPGELNADASTDGRRIAYSLVRDGQHEIWTRPLDAEVERLLFKGRGGTFSKAKWSADDRQVVLTRRWTPVDGTAPKVELILVSSTAKDVHVVPLAGLTYFVPSDWSADGRSVLGACQQEVSDPIKLCAVAFSRAAGARDVHVTVLATDRARELRNAHVSPDQRWIVFQALDRNPQGSSSLFIMPTAGGAWTSLSTGGSFDDKPRWSPDGKTLYFVSDRQGGARNVWGRRVDTTTGTPVGEPFPVTTFRSDERTISGDARNMDIALTSSRLLLPITESTGHLWMLDAAGDH